VNRALLVGCARYEDDDIAKLQYADHDARKIGDVLRIVCGVPDSGLTVLHDGAPQPGLRPTRTNILRQLSRLRAEPGGGILFFFFSGHGFQSPTGQQYLLPIDCVRAALEETALEFDKVVGHLGAAGSRHTILFLDACRNVVEGGKSAGPGIPAADVSRLCPPGLVTFCSCEPGTFSYEAAELESGVFSAALGQAFSDAGRCRTVYELDSFLLEAVPRLGRGLGKPVQTPYSRVEPLGIQHLEVVSDSKRNEWRRTTPLGAEKRTRQVPPLPLPQRPADPLIAVDFGTSYSTVSWADEAGRVVLLPGGDGRLVVPSVVHFLPNFDYLVGAEAVEVDRYNPASTVRHGKRVLGTDTTFDVAGRSIAPELAASLVIRSLKRNAEEALGVPVHRCVAAHPANFSLAQIAALRRAFELAGLEVVRMAGEPNLATMNVDGPNEPGAAALVLVVDLGGGTFDVAVVDCGEGVNEVVACAGSNEVGGLDYDTALVGYATERLALEHGVVVTPTVKEVVRREAERAKRALTTQETTNLLLTDVDDGERGLRDVSIGLDRATFRQVTRELNDRIEQILRSVSPHWRRRGSWLGKGDTRAVLLAGQGTKIFTVREIAERFDPGVPVLSQYQETAVGRGAGFIAGVLSGSIRDHLLLDVLRYGIAIRCTRAYEEETPTRRKVAVIGPGATTEVVEIVAPNTTIPTLRRIDLEFPDAAGTPRTIELIGLPLEPREDLGRLSVHPSGQRIGLIIEVDANSTVGMTLDEGGVTTRFALAELHPQLAVAVPGESEP
jgi:molecular chaperone DnaK (HSP70)/uncharacterized caspase-like protein